MKPTVDPKRTGVRAFLIPGWPEGGYADPGAVLRSEDKEGRYAGTLLFACPGCGEFGSVRCNHPKPAESPSWDILAGTPDDPTTLTLSPSIHCRGCCGWHGYLRNGVFESC